MYFYNSESIHKSEVREVRRLLEAYVIRWSIDFCAICFHSDSDEYYHLHMAVSKPIDYIPLKHNTIKLSRKCIDCSLKDFLNYVSWSGKLELLDSGRTHRHDIIRSVEGDLIDNKNTGGSKT